ncbi:MAG TPA: GIY-YIG nuclease family protein [Halanaerobiales bacterium]|nr:GIY-YIG nuclease family protein [Halanaerobiales bacterium]
MNFVYIVKCSDNTLYTGYTTELKRRIKEHNNGQGAKYTRGRTPVELVYYEKKESKSLAMKREYEIKQLNRKEKIELIENKKREN